jgi:hypothetical protein
MDVVSGDAELAAVLRRIAELAGHDDVDTAWSGYEAGELRSEIRSFLEKAEAGLPLDKAEREHLRFLPGETTTCLFRSAGSWVTPAQN